VVIVSYNGELKRNESMIVVIGVEMKMTDIDDDN